MTKGTATLLAGYGVLALVLIFIFANNNPSPQAPEAIIQEVVRTESVFVTDTLRLRRILTKWDTVRVRDTITVNNVVYVPKVTVDSIVAACRPLPTSCDNRVRAVRDSAKAVRNRAWQAAGLTYPFGAFYERDVSRLRAGGSVRMDPDGKVRGELRVGVRW